MMRFNVRPCHILTNFDLIAAVNVEQTRENRLHANNELNMCASVFFDDGG